LTNAAGASRLALRRARAAGVWGDVKRSGETPVPRAAPNSSREMARRHRAQASRDKSAPPKSWERPQDARV